MPENTNKPRVLYVEDEPLPRWTGGKLLESLGAHVLTAESCAHAENLWLNNELDFVVCDWRLGDGMATDLVERMRQAGHDEPVVCLTGEAEELNDEIRERLGLRAVLRKPIDSKAMAGLLAGARSKPKPSAPIADGAFAADNFDLPVWVSPIWGLRARVGAMARAGRLLIAPGAEGDVWVAAFGCADARAHGSAAVGRLRQAIAQAAGSLPASAPATALLAETRVLLARGIDAEHDWNLEVLHFCAVGISAASNGPVGLRVWFAPDAGAWQAMEWAHAKDAMQQVDRAIISFGAGAPAALWSELGAGMNEQATGVKQADFDVAGFWMRPPGRLIDWAEVARAGGALTEALDRLEQALELDGMPPDMTRQAACGIFDLVEWSGAGRVAVSWSKGSGVEVLLAGAQPPPKEFVRFFNVVEIGAEGSLLAVRPNDVPRIEAAAQRPVASLNAPAPSRVGRFVLARLPRLVTEEAAAAIAHEHKAEMWLALDCSSARHVGSRALAIWNAMAAERRASGRFCLTNYSGRMGRLFRRMSLHQTMEMAATHDELEAAARHLTTSCERASLLGSIVGGGSVP